MAENIKGYPSTEVAQSILDLCRAEGIDTAISPMKLIKLTYIAHGWMLGLFGRPLVGEYAEAWRYGPVFPRLYQAIKHFRSSPVSCVANGKAADLDGEQKALLKAVCERYGTRTAMDLSMLTHKDGSPWHQTWDGTMFKEISNDLIEHHYATRAKESGASNGR